MPFFNLRPVEQNCSLVTFYINKPGGKVNPHPGDEGVGILLFQASRWVQEKNLLLPGVRMGASDGFVTTFIPAWLPGPRFGLGQDCGMKRGGGFTLGRGRLAIQAFLFCVSIHLKLWGQQMSDCCLQAWGKSLIEDSHLKKFCYMDGVAASFFKTFINKFLWYSKEDIRAGEKSHSQVSKLSYF